MASAFRDATTKFTYYIAGVSLAILAFSIQTYAAPNPSWLKWLFALSWFFYLLSFLGCLLRLEANLSLHHVEAQFERRVPLMDAIEQQAQRGGPIMNQQNQELMGPEEIANLVADFRRYREDYKQTAEGVVRKFQRSYNLALGGLVLGLGLHSFAKVYAIMST
jgi:hypothetical protein